MHSLEKNSSGRKVYVKKYSHIILVLFALNACSNTKPAATTGSNQIAPPNADNTAGSTCPGGANVTSTTGSGDPFTQYIVCKFAANEKRAWIKPGNAQARSICVYPVLFQNGFRQLYTSGNTTSPTAGSISVGCFNLENNGIVVDFSVGGANAMYIIPGNYRSQFEQCLISAPAPEACANYHSYGQWR